jgi:hypothetical protein
MNGLDTLKCKVVHLAKLYSLNIANIIVQVRWAGCGCEGRTTESRTQRPFTFFTPFLESAAKSQAQNLRSNPSPRPSLVAD